MLSYSSSTSSRTLRQGKRKNAFSPLLSSSLSTLHYIRVRFLVQWTWDPGWQLSPSRNGARSSSDETTQQPRRKGGLQDTKVGIWNKGRCNTFLFVERITVFVWQLKFFLHKIRASYNDEHSDHGLLECAASIFVGDHEDEVRKFLRRWYLPTELHGVTTLEHPHLKYVLHRHLNAW
jgi:hypothetical protein